MNASNISYIYGLSSSDKKDIVRYIGYSNNPKRRFSEHIQEAKTGVTKKCRWIKSHINKGDNIILHVLVCCSELEIGKKEIETILLYKSFGANLLNHNNGGLGGISPDSETRRKISEFHKGNTWYKFKEKKPIKEKVKKERPIAKNRLFSEEQVLELYKLHSNGIGFNEILNLKNISKTQLNNLFYNPKRYKNVKLKHNLLLIKQKPGVRNRER